MKHCVLGFILWTSLTLSLNAQSDSTVTLARILSDRGTITTTELARVEAADQNMHLATLAAILKDKGLLDSGDLAKLSLPSPTTVGTAPVPVVTAALPKESAGTPVTTKKGVPVSLYGTLLFTTGYNTAPFNIEDVSMIAGKQGSDPTGGDKNFYAAARQSRVGMNLNPVDALGGKLSGAFEFDLMGGASPYVNGIGFDLFRLRLAYGRVDWKHFAIEGGQDWSVFAPLNPTSMNEFGIPEFTAAGNAWIRAPQVRLEAKSTNASGNNLLWQFAALDPNIGDNSTTAVVVARQPGIGERGRMPSLESRLAFTKNHDDRNFTFGISSHYQRAKNATTVGAVTLRQPFDSWGVALDYSLPITKIIAITGEAYEGRALGVYSVASGESVGAVNSTGGHGVFSRGGWAQIQLNWNKQWQSNIAYGIDQPQDSQIPVGNRSRNQQYMANVIDRLTRNINLSVEYRRILTDYRNQLPANERGDHVDLGIAYVF